MTCEYLQCPVYIHLHLMVAILFSFSRADDNFLYDELCCAALCSHPARIEEALAVIS
jgi:hypothetical protein